MRLKRMGAKKRPVYRVVVADSRSPRDGRFIEEIGYYDPTAEPTVIKFQEERVAEWLRRGAQPSERVQNLLQRAGLTATPAGEVADA
ncbi:MAG: 30S ribosomal protein S16 [Thermaerobacter sp.]|jgi:small subunit ribosomal protein S16|nr:30S ribosomal protein S16 [Thermaerobacter sp.]MDA8145842.1 30S ribosomal protein S16 [Thermaerobacter sp.]